MAGKQFFGKKWQMTLCIPYGIKSFFKIALSHTISEINIILFFYTEIQDGCQKRQEKIFWQKVADDCIYPVGQKFCQNRFIHYTLFSVNGRCLFVYPMG